MKTIALIGCGALSHIFARNLLRILPGEFRITGVMARHAGSAESFADTLDCRFFTEIDPLLALKPDFVIEFAGGAAVREYGEAVLRSGATIAELAKQIGVPAATLEETMKRYNENVAFGFDRDFYKEREWLTPINKGPFYAIKIAPYSFTSIGGIKIDQYMHALDKNNQPVKGLYCTGMDAGGMYGDSYPVWFSGNAFGFSSWSGRHAALQAIEDEKL